MVWLFTNSYRQLNDIITNINSYSETLYKDLPNLFMVKNEYLKVVKNQPYR